MAAPTVLKLCRNCDENRNFMIGELSALLGAALTT